MEDSSILSTSCTIWDNIKFNQKKVKLIMKKILISTGGSGGHVIPGIILYDHCKENFKTYLTTDERGLKFIDQKNYSCYLINTPKISKNILIFPYNLLLFFNSVFKSFFYLRSKKIDLLFSTGGYMSLPLCLSAKLLNIKIILLEPNMVLGRSNKFFLKYSSKIICYSRNIKNFPEKFKNKIFLIKSLLRKEIYIEKKNTNNYKNGFRVLVIGGSQGASFFDKKITDLIIELFKEKKISIIQQVSNKKKIPEIKSKYDEIGIKNDLFNFDDKIYRKYHEVDFAITRSGASTIHELVFFEIPFLAIPFPLAKDNHQFYNSKYLFNENLCWLMNQEDFQLPKAKKFLLNLIVNKDEFFLKKRNMEKFSYQNSWNDVNQKLIDLINEN